jgi:hypothetical protein
VAYFLEKGIGDPPPHPGVLRTFGAVAELLIPDVPDRWRDRVRDNVHPMLGSTIVTVALVIVGAVSIFAPLVGVLAIAAVTTVLIHAGIRAAVNR